MCYCIGGSMTSMATQCTHLSSVTWSPRCCILAATRGQGVLTEMRSTAPYTQATLHWQVAAHWQGKFKSQEQDPLRTKEI